mmetsp:Transcript_82727/g.146045  ORF Transcript_82727/g.146045 Transcript_82727/m.146045 type:complete len:226 (-) Transcript_82727:97-774(-)
MTCDAEVHDLKCVVSDRRLRQEEEILRLQIAVTNTSLVHVDHCAKDLFHDDGRIGLGHPSLVNNDIEELPSSTQLHHEVYLLIVFEGLEELHNIRMVHRHHGFNLFLHPVFIRYPRLQDALHSPQMATLLVSSTADCCKATSPQNFLSVQVEVVCDFLPRVLYGVRLEVQSWLRCGRLELAFSSEAAKAHFLVQASLQPCITRHLLTRVVTSFYFSIRISLAILY